MPWLLPGDTFWNPGRALGGSLLKRLRLKFGEHVGQGIKEEKAVQREICMEIKPRGGDFKAEGDLMAVEW